MGFPNQPILRKCTIHLLLLLVVLSLLSPIISAPLTSSQDSNSNSSSGSPCRSEQTYTCYFGNLHSHTALSDGSGSPEEAFYHARYVAGLDFLAVTDHAELLSQSEWLELKMATERYTETGTFLSLHGFEWTSGGPQALGLAYGHQIVLDPDQYLRSFNCNLSTFYRFVRNDPHALGMFHPTFGNRYDNFSYQPEWDEAMYLFELHNSASEVSHPMYPQGRFEDVYQRALSKGWHVGAVANQDNHDPDWGDRDTSRTGVWAANLTKSGILGALKARRCFATEVPVELAFKANGHWMGETLPMAPSGNTALTFSVQATNASAPIQMLELLRNTTVVAAYPVDNATTVKWEYESENIGTAFYYVRVTFTDGHLAWSSPIWVEEGSKSITHTDAQRDCLPRSVNTTLYTEYMLSGQSAHEAFGSAITCGDFNSDGVPDLVVGAPKYDFGTKHAAGAIRLYIGSITSAAWTTQQTADMLLVGANAFDEYGYALAAHDLNGDGTDDLIVGAHMADTESGLDSGAVSIHLGTSWGVEAKAWLILNGVQGKAHFGKALAIGDLNGDGWPDLCVGASGSNLPGSLGTGIGSAGQVWVYYGNATGLGSTIPTVINGTYAYSEFGHAVAIGDLNADGYDDLVVSAPYQLTYYAVDPWKESHFGRVSIYYGSAEGLLVNHSAMINGTSSQLILGEALAVGDLNNDSLPDLAVMARPADTSILANGGNLTLYLDHSSGADKNALILTPTTTIEKEGNDWLFSTTLATGDLNNDALPEFVVTDASAGWVGMYDQTYSLQECLMMIIKNGSGSTGYGRALTIADLDNDSFEDLVIGAPYTDTVGAVGYTFGGPQFTYVPELTFSCIELSSTTVVVGDHVCINATIENHGLKPLDDVDLALIVNGTLIGITQAHFDDQQRAAVSFEWAPNISGDRALELIIDLNHTLTEVNTSNNRETVMLMVLPSSPPSGVPDLYVLDHDLGLMSGSFVANESVQFILRCAASNLTTPQTIELGFMLNGTLINRTSMLMIPNQSTTQRFVWLAVEGIHQISVMIDPSNLINESDETNNAVTTVLTIHPAALDNGENDTDSTTQRSPGKGPNSELFYWVLGVITALGVIVYLVRSRK